MVPVKLQPESPGPPDNGLHSYSQRMKGVTRSGEQLSSNFRGAPEILGTGAALDSETLIVDLRMCILKEAPEDSEAGVVDSSGENTVARFSGSSDLVQAESPGRQGWNVTSNPSSLCFQDPALWGPERSSLRTGSRANSPQ